MVTWDIVAISMLVLGIIGFFLYIVYHASVERKYIDVLIGRGILSIDSGVLFAGVDRPSLISAVLPSSYPERARFGQIDSDKLVVILDAFKESYRDTLGVFVITKLDCDSGIGLHAVARSRLRGNPVLSTSRKEEQAWPESSEVLSASPKEQHLTTRCIH